jgi:hypothetical protein
MGTVIAPGANVRTVLVAMAAAAYGWSEAYWVS